MIYLSGFVFLILAELLYFKLAYRYNIIDHPNERSSHTRVTLRGGGILFPFAVTSWFMLSHQYMPFVTGMILISIISFWDDIKSLPNSLRIVIHFLSVVLLIYQLDVSIPGWGYPLILILIIGILNAYNFMDGINGITGLYSLVVLASLLYVNEYHLAFSDKTLLIWLILAVVVFGIFNFRKKARCFAGDIGSMSIAFALCFLIALLIKQTGDFKYILFLLVYGLDTVTTIFFRLLRKENIFKAHRSHFYQYLANERKLPHLVVSTIYGFTQLVINFLIILLNDLSLSSVLILVILFGIVFISLRMFLEGKGRLLIPQKN